MGCKISKIVVFFRELDNWSIRLVICLEKNNTKNSRQHHGRTIVLWWCIDEYCLKSNKNLVITAIKTKKNWYFKTFGLWQTFKLSCVKVVFASISLKFAPSGPIKDTPMLLSYNRLAHLTWQAIMCQWWRCLLKHICINGPARVEGI